jgi:prepilin-type N-terminal cleavage/methylation domain-containing protein
MKRNNSGFTMVELLVTVAVSSIVLAAAASLMLLGLRVHQTTQKEAGEQQTVRIVLSALEDLSASGKIYRVEPLSDGWQLQGKTADGTPGAVLLRYNSGKLRSGASGDQVLLDNLRGARVDLDGSLVTFTFATAAHSYSTSVFCRTGIEGDSVGKAEAEDILKETPTLPDAADLTDTEKAARFAFLQKLADQYDSRGEIKSGDSTYTYFSEWYIGDYAKNPGWNQYTPWCGCFLSWGAEQQRDTIDGDPPKFADVDKGMADFKAQKNKWRNPNDANNKPIPGDYVFFDWDGGTDPDHVGAVLCVEGNFLYTIEGNSGGKVAVNRYPLSDKRIVGYGVLNWKTGEETTE